MLNDTDIKTVNQFREEHKERYEEQWFSAFLHSRHFLVRLKALLAKCHLSFHSFFDYRIITNQFCCKLLRKTTKGQKVFNMEDSYL